MDRQLQIPQTMRICLCDFNGRFAKVFDFLTHRLLEIPYSTDIKLERSQWYQINHTNWRNADPLEVNVFMDQGEVRARTWAVTPGKLEDEADEDETELEDGEIGKKAEIAQKYEQKVWSQDFGFLNDPKSLFRYGPGAQAHVLIRYAPTDQAVFEIIGVGEEYPDGQLTKQTPWQLELAGNLEQPKHPEKLVNISRKMSNRTIVKHALCLAHESHNRSWNPKKQGSKPRCSYFFNAGIGVYKSMNAVTKPGAWYQHLFNDNRSHKKRDFLVFEDVHAISPSVIETKAPLETKFTEEGKILKIATKVLLSEIKKEERGSPYFFWDLYLGKVNLSGKDKKFISEQVNMYSNKTKGRTPTTSYELELYEIKVTVQLYCNYLDSVKQYPQEGFFEVVTIKRIIDLSRDTMIYER